MGTRLAREVFSCRENKQNKQAYGKLLSLCFVVAFCMYTRKGCCLNRTGFKCPVFFWDFCLASLFVERGDIV